VVAGERVDRDDRRHPVQPDVLDLLAQVRPADVDLVRVLGEQRLRQRPAGDDLVPARVRLERPHGRHDDRGVGVRPDARHLMLKNRSAPMSAPNPASVTRNSPPWMPMRSATTDEFPWAMLPNGPGVHEDRRVLQRLHEVGLQRVAHDDRPWRRRRRCPPR
jgi:hypothetical protein